MNLMTVTNLSRLNACMMCGNQVNEIVNVNGSYAVSHFCDDFDTIVVSEPEADLDDLVVRWNSKNADPSQK